MRLVARSLESAFAPKLSWYIPLQRFYKLLICRSNLTLTLHDPVYPNVAEEEAEEEQAEEKPAAKKPTKAAAKKDATEKKPAAKKPAAKKETKVCLSPLPTCLCQPASGKAVALLSSFTGPVS